MSQTENPYTDTISLESGCLYSVQLRSAEFICLSLSGHSCKQWFYVEYTLKRTEASN